jgi:hypothetical protein
MLTAPELQDLVRELDGVPVLSLYVDARVTDPAMRHARRPAMMAALRAERARLTDEDARAAFDRAASFVNDPVPPLDGAWGTPGWAAFITADGPRHAAALPVRVPMLATWREGPFVSPYLRALKQLRPVIIAVVDSRSARLYRYAMNELTELPGITLAADDTAGAASVKPNTQRGSAFPAARGALDTEHAARRRRAEFQHLATLLAHRLTGLAGDDGWILIGGTASWARLAAEALPAEFAQRTHVSPELDHGDANDVIVRIAKDAATRLRAAHSDLLLDRLLDRAGAGGRAAAGVPATQRALHERAVDQLLLSPEFVSENATLAEDVVRTALAQSADVEVLSGDAAVRLQAAADGIAARLRYAVDAPRSVPGGD